MRSLCKIWERTWKPSTSPPRSVEVMQQRGVKHAYCINLFDDNFLTKYDTILMLMNGSGIIGKLENMGMFFAKMKQLLNPGG